MTSVSPGAPSGPDGKGPARARRDRRVVIIALALIVPVFLLFVGAIAGVVFYMLKSSDAYKVAEAMIRESEELRSAVSGDLKLGWFPTGSIQTSGGGSGHAELAIRVSGSAGKTTVYVTLRREAGRWRITSAAYEDRAGVVRPLRPRQSAGEPAPETAARSPGADQARRHVARGYELSGGGARVPALRVPADDPHRRGGTDARPQAERVPASWRTTLGDVHWPRTRTVDGHPAVTGGATPWSR